MTSPAGGCPPTERPSSSDREDGRTVPGPCARARYVVSLSGGKDSTAMLLRLLEEGRPVDEIVFCDTGWEYPEILRHIASLEAYTGAR